MLTLYNVPRNNKDIFGKEEDTGNDQEEDNGNDQEEDKGNELMVTIL